MRSTQRAALLALLIPALALSPRSAHADIHGWTLCTPSSFHSCHSVEIATTALMAGPTRIGTGVTIKITNLQGSGYLSDNTSLSGLYEVIFSRQGLPMVFTVTPHSATMTGAGSSGSANWYSETGTDLQIGGYVAGYPNGNGTIGGCAGGALVFGYTTSANTCGATAMAVFSFTSGNIFDASQFQSLFIEAFGASEFDYCFSDPSKSDPSFPACDVQAEYITNVTPEPVTMALLGTGLFGIGGARLRRRRKTTDV